MTHHNSADCLCPGGINIDLPCDVDSLRGWVPISASACSLPLPCPAQSLWRLFYPKVTAALAAGGGGVGVVCHLPVRHCYTAVERRWLRAGEIDTYRPEDT